MVNLNFVVEFSNGGKWWKSENRGENSFFSVNWKMGINFPVAFQSAKIDFSNLIEIAQSI